jgi:putative membrane protein
MNMWHWNEGMGWWMMFGGVWMVVFWGALIAFIVWGITKITRKTDSSKNISEKSDPFEIAKERYARGEITKKEFDQLKKDLS